MYWTPLHLMMSHRSLRFKLSQRWWQFRPSHGCSEHAF
jgi:hypothetical protein